MYLIRVWANNKKYWFSKTRRPKRLPLVLAPARARAWCVRRVGCGGAGAGGRAATHTLGPSVVPLQPASPGVLDTVPSFFLGILYILSYPIYPILNTSYTSHPILYTSTLTSWTRSSGFRIQPLRLFPPPEEGSELGAQHPPPPYPTPQPQLAHTYRLQHCSPGAEVVDTDVRGRSGTARGEAECWNIPYRTAPTRYHTVPISV